MESSSASGRFQIDSLLSCQVNIFVLGSETRERHRLGEHLERDSVEGGGG